MTRLARLRRLCDIRRVEEQNWASLLQSAKAETQRIDRALEEAQIRKRAGRVLVEGGIRGGRTVDRVAGFEEIACATRLYRFLMQLKQVAEEQVRAVQEQYFGKRAERRQVETLLQIQLEHEADEALRRSQSSLDEWHRMTRSGRGRDAGQQ